jgi:type VI secretion system protein ImpG
MNEDFLKAYETELEILYERGAAFAQMHPEIARNLGLLARDHYDPGIKGLFEGAAFLAARVQVKIADEFDNFTQELLEQVLPDALAPVPSLTLLQFAPRSDDKDAAKGVRYPAGALLGVSAKAFGRQFDCQYRLGEPVTIWPLEVTRSRYFASPDALESMGFGVSRDARGGLVIDLDCTVPLKTEDTLAELALDRLRVHLTGSTATAGALYEQVHGRCCGLGLIYETPAGDAKFIRLDPGCIAPIGFGAEEALLPHDARLLRGYAYLREYFAFPQKFMGFDITGLNRALRMCQGRKLRLVLEFSETRQRLEAEVTRDNTRLHCAAAANLFLEEGLSVTLKGRDYDIALPDANDREIYRVTKVRVHRGRQAIDDCLPLYRVPARADLVRPRARYSTRRRRRVADIDERRELRVSYAGSDTLLTLYDPPDLGEESPVLAVRVDCLCTNRHLPVLLSSPASAARFHLLSDQTVKIAAVAGPTAPREAFTERRRQRDQDAGPALWRLISYLSLNQFGLQAADPEDRAAHLREILTLFADAGDPALATSLLAITDFQTEPKTRSILRDRMAHTARGTVVTVTVDESAATGLPIMVLGAVLDRFFAEYASVNSFTQTVIRSESRGVIHTWPPRSGEGPLL